MQSFRRDKPLLVYDGECSFCSAWARRWHQRNSESFDCVPYHDVSVSLPQISHESFRESVQLVLPDGEVLSGARAVFEMLAKRGFGGWLWAYLHVPGFAWASEVLYRLIARHRHRCSSFVRPASSRVRHNPPR